MGVNWFGNVHPSTGLNVNSNDEAIVLRNPQCLGNETDIMSCPFSHVETCDHSHDVGVKCIRYPGEKEYKNET